MAQNNSTIIQDAWLAGTNDFQQRIPSPSTGNIATTIRGLFDPVNSNLYGQFVDNLIRRIGLAYTRQQSWKNPLSAFKRGELPYGATVQEIQAKWVKAHSYMDDKQTLLKVHRPEVEAAYHELNFENQYPITVNKVELRQSFTSEYGLNEYVASIMDSVINSANYDEYRSMLELLAFYNESWGFFKIEHDEPDDDATAKSFLKSLKAMVAKLAFPSSRYNAGVINDIPVFSRPEDLVLLISPDASASVDVDALATLFNLEPADARVRKVIVDEFPIPGAYALLTTEDFFQVYDVLTEMGSFYNPETLNTNYYYTIMRVMSVSPFVPAIVWTSTAGAGSETPTITQTVSTNQVTGSVFYRNEYGAYSAVSGAVTREQVDNDGIFVFGELSGSLSDGTISNVQEIGGISVSPDAYVVTGLEFTAGAGETAPEVNSRTYIDRNGRLHLQAAAYRSAGGLTLTVTLESAYVNPSGATPTATPSTVSIQIAGTE